MHAVIDRPTHAPAWRRVVAPARPATTTAPVLRGIHFLTEHSIYYPPSISVTDVLEVDFDQHHVEHDGTYLIAYPGTTNPHCGPWGGARRFQRMPMSGLHIFEGDQWVKIHAGHRDMIVIGQVLHVYRRTK